MIIVTTLENKERNGNKTTVLYRSLWTFIRLFEISSQLGGQQHEVIPIHAFASKMV